MKTIARQLLLALGFAIAFSNWDISPRIVAHNAVLASEKSLPDPPKDPPPSNQTKPGGGLDPERNACNSPGRSLTALVPRDNPVYTTSAHPAILFYVPDRAEDVREAEFFIHTTDEEGVGEIIRFQLPNTPGIISISLPKRPESALKEDRDYHWYFRLRCAGSSPSKATTIAVSGWIRRLPRTAELELAISNATPEIWYDAIASLAQHRLAAPDDEILRERWLKLLQQIDGEALIEQPFLGQIAVE